MKHAKTFVFLDPILPCTLFLLLLEEDVHEHKRIINPGRICWSHLLCLLHLQFLIIGRTSKNVKLNGRL